jgi:hypothetical protein
LQIPLRFTQVTRSLQVLLAFVAHTLPFLRTSSVFCAPASNSEKAATAVIADEISRIRLSTTLLD